MCDPVQCVTPWYCVCDVTRSVVARETNAEEEGEYEYDPSYQEYYQDE